MADQKHKWEEVELPVNLESNYRAKFICVRGDCHCVRLLGKSINTPTLYTRDGNRSDYAPRCHGDIPLNLQGIDD